MEKFIIVGKDKDNISVLREEMEDYGFSSVWFKPDFVVALGGHGAFFYSEYKYPRIPKLWIRDEKIVELFRQDKLRLFLESLMMKKYKIMKLHKVEVEFNGKILKGVNDIIVRNADQRECIRFKVRVGRKRVGDVLIGDGVVVSSVYGCTGYYCSICGKVFKKGLGIAFNNLIDDRKAFSFSERLVVDFELVRGEAFVSVDNCPKMFKIKEGDKVLIRKSKEYASLIETGI